MMSDVSDSDAGRETTEERVEHLPGWLIAIGVGLALGYAGFVVLLWRLGLFDVPEEGPDARIFAAVFALLGGLFGAVLTFAAALLKHTVDTRTLALSLQTERRLALENRQTEGRLRLETSLRAVDLLSAADGTESPPAKQAGSLFALAYLGQLDLALALLAQAWPAGGIPNHAAMWIIDRGLQSDDEALQELAATIYRNNVDKLDTGGDDSFSVPRSLEWTWSPDLARYARMQLLDAFILGAASRSSHDWPLPVVAGFLSYLYDVHVSDPWPAIRSASSRALAVLLENQDPTDAVNLRGEDWLALGEMQAEVAEFQSSDTYTGTFFNTSLEVLTNTWGSAGSDTAGPSSSPSETI